MKAYKHLVVLIAAVCAIIPAGAVFAYMTADTPDYKPVSAVASPNATRIESIHGFRNLAEDGDRAFIFHWDYDYDAGANTTQPSEPSSQTLLYRLFDTDGTTLLATGTPYVYAPFDVNGYEDNIGGIYFSDADNLTWGQAYVLSVYGSPAFFSPAVEVRYTLEADDYTASNTTTANRAELYSQVLLYADIFSSLYSGVDLKSTSDSGIVLSSYGELFFGGAIDGLQSLCPDLFFIQVYIPEQMAVQSYNLTQQTTYTERTANTEIGRGFERLGEYLGGMSKSFAATMVWCLILGGIVIWCLRKGWGVDAGLLMSLPIGILGAVLMGDILFTILMCASLVAGMGIMWLFTLKKA